MIQAYYHTLLWSHWTLSFVHIQNWDRDLVEVLDDGCQQLQWELPTQVAQCKYSSRPQHTNAVTQQGMTITTFPNTKPKKLKCCQKIGSSGSFYIWINFLFIKLIHCVYRLDGVSSLSWEPCSGLSCFGLPCDALRFLRSVSAFLGSYDVLC